MQPWEVGPRLTVPMLSLAGLCAAIGLLPVLVVPAALTAAAVVTGGDPAAARVAAGRGPAQLSLATAALAAALWAAWLARGALMRGRWRTVARTWGCGFLEPTPRMQYTASSFAAPTLEPFGAAAGVREERSAASFRTRPRDPGLEGLILPAWRGGRAVADRLRLLQMGRLHVYLLYVLATVLALLCYLALRRAP